MYVNQKSLTSLWLLLRPICLFHLGLLAQNVQMKYYKLWKSFRNIVLTIRCYPTFFHCHGECFTTFFLLVKKLYSRYPNKLAWQVELTQKDMKSYDAYSNLHNFLVKETERGTISTQATVSMIPALLLNVKPHHMVNINILSSGCY